MSQINDALKRAKNIQLKTATSGMSPMLPVESNDTQPGPWWLWPIVIVLFLILFAGLCLAISAGSGQMGKNIIAEAAPTPAPEVQSVVAPVPVPPPIAPTAEALEASEPKPARLQGIVFDPVNPWAIISGKTVHVGDAVDGMRVAFISRDAVILAGNGLTNRLQVGQY